MQVWMRASGGVDGGMNAVGMEVSMYSSTSCGPPSPNMDRRAYTFLPSRSNFSKKSVLPPKSKVLNMSSRVSTVPGVFVLRTQRGVEERTRLPPKVMFTIFDFGGETFFLVASFVVSFVSDAGSVWLWSCRRAEGWREELSSILTPKIECLEHILLAKHGAWAAWCLCIRVCICLRS